MMKDIGNSILGNVETAYLVVDDYRALRKPPASVVSPKKQSAVKKDTATALTKGATATSPPPPKSEKKYFKVQFNPTELQLDGNVSYAVKSGATVNEKGVKNEASGFYVKPIIILSVALVFDDTNISDAFMSDHGGSGVASAVTNVASAAATIRGKTWSVKPQVMALLSTLHSGYTRFVTFYWSDFSFCGQIVSVDAEYSMFSTEGRPVRATVNLRISQELDPANLNTWYAEFSQAFGQYDSLVGGAQKVASIFNLNL